MNSEYIKIDGPIKQKNLLKKEKAKISIRNIRILFKFSSRSELIAYFIVIFLIIVASIIPLLYFIQISTAMEEMKLNYNDREKFYNNESKICIMMFYYGTGYLIISWLSCFLILYLSRQQGYKWKTLYFKAIINKPVSYYDEEQNKISSKNILTDCQNIEEALGDRMMLFLSAMSLLIGVWILAFMSSIELALVCSIILPCQYFSIRLLDKTYMRGFKKSMKLYNNYKHKLDNK